MARAVSQVLATEGCLVELRFNAEGVIDPAAAGFDLIVVVAARTAASTSLELLGRVGMALHRLRRGTTPPRTLSCSDLRIDVERGSVDRDGRPVSLTAKELDLLRHLVDQRPIAISRDELLRSVWAYQDGVNTRTVDVHMSSLRQKLERDPRRPKHLRTVRGVGYRFLA